LKYLAALFTIYINQKSLYLSAST